MMLQNALAAFSQHAKIYTEADVGCLGSGDRLKQQIDRSASIQARQLGSDVREATRLRRNAQHRNQAFERAQDSCDNLDGIRGRIHSDDGVSATVQQAVEGSQQNAAHVVRRMVWLQANAENAALAHGVPATRDVANLGCRKHQILVAHQLRDGCRHLGRDAPLEGLQVSLRSPVVEDELTKRAHGHAADSLES